MKKTLYILIPLIGLNLLIGYLLIHPPVSPGSDHIRIALALPLSSAHGRDIERALEMAAEQVNAEGGVNGTPIELVAYDDGDTLAGGQKAAQDIIKAGDILAVIGHYSSAAALGAAKAYMLNEMPAITATATAEALTRDNPWYFRTIASNRVQAVQSADYIVRQLNRNTACLVSDDDSGAVSLTRNFETEARERNIEIKGRWHFSSFDRNLALRLEQIAGEIAAIGEDPGIVFLSTRAVEGAELVLRLRNGGCQAVLMGTEAFAENTFVETVRHSALCQKNPEFYLDGLYCTTPTMIDADDETAHGFRQSFYERYQTDPSWSAAAYYDALRLAVSAMRRAGIRGDAYLRDDRRQLRDALMEFANTASGFDSQQGPLFFDRNGDVFHPYGVNVYRRQQLIPALTQYRLASDSDDLKNRFQKVMQGYDLIVGRHVLERIQVIYADMNLIGVTALDRVNGKATVDFQLGLRYSGNFDLASLEFPGSVEKLALNRCTPETYRQTDDVTTSSYRLQSDFRINLDYDAFPFVTFIVPISLRYSTRSGNRLVALKGLVAFPATADTQDPELQVRSVTHSKKFFTKSSTLGNPDYIDTPVKTILSQLDLYIKLRPGNGYCDTVRIFCYPLLLFLCGYLILWLPPHHLFPRLLALTALCFILEAILLRSYASLPGNDGTPVEYLVTFILWITVLCVYLTVKLYNHHTSGAHDRVAIILKRSRGFYLGIGLVAAVYLSIMYAYLLGK